ncbi:MAG: glycosyltransferase [Candidatus Helarchaeota archaeon]|nr:glycosyltransferase [Candidatus Helarchaeota archaeon]
MIYDISVIKDNSNRSEDLAKTLKGLARLKKGNLSVEFVIVDNGSNDGTKSIVESFSNCLPVRYLFEPRVGKNRALNHALEKGGLGNIVVFTDDDVDPSPNWLTSIVSTCERWPQHSVFGGQIDVVLPKGSIPKWVYQPYIRSWVFAEHRYSDKECFYEGGATPFGPNFWVRKDIFNNGRRFDETVGPHPTNRILGGDISFLLGLLNDGYKIVYSPTAVVGHRIQPTILKISAIWRRAYQAGRGVAHIYGLPQVRLLNRYPSIWRLYRYGAIMWNTYKALFSLMFYLNERRAVKWVWRITDIGYHIEAIRLSRAIENISNIKKDLVKSTAKSY